MLFYKYIQMQHVIYLPAQCRSMTNYAFLLIITILMLSCSKDTDIKATQQRGNYSTLVWADEFDYSGLPNPEYWGYEEGYVRNNEVQYYVAGRLENSRVENGRLIITALNDNFEGLGITSASIKTQHKIDLHYGRVEVRAKLPVGKGAWPAIWTLGVNREEVGWPGCGEIDIMEWLGWMPNFIWGSLYTTKVNGTVSPRLSRYIVRSPNNVSTQFHTYAMEWDSTQIRMFFDDKNYKTYRKSGMSITEWSPFTKPHYLLLNLAMGGNSGGKIDLNQFPFVYEIDYVRYYQ